MKKTWIIPVLLALSIIFSACDELYGVLEVHVNSVTIKPATKDLKIGDTQTLKVQVLPSSAKNRDITWEIDDPDNAITLSDDEVTAVNEGTATITVTTVEGGFTASCVINVYKTKPVAVKNVSLDKTNFSLAPTATQTLTATVSPGNATNKAVSWSNSNPSVASITGTGLTVTITGVSNGTTNITVTTNDGGYTATCRVTVTGSAVAVTGVSVSPTTLSLADGGTGSLTATVAPTNATNKTVNWTSSNPAVATVSPATSTSGGSITVTAVGAGSTTITATSAANPSASATCTVTVTAAGTVLVNSVSLDKATLALTIGGTTTGTLTATLDPTNATNQNVSWNSSAPGVATVTGTGLGPVTVTAVTAGTTTVTVTTADGNRTATCTVTVTGAGSNIPVTDVTLDKATLGLTIGGTTTGTLTATLDPTNATNQNVSWNSSAPGVATVTGTGLGPVTVTAVTAGTTTVTVTTADGSHTASCLVTVSPANIAVADVTLDKATLALTIGGTTTGTLTATLDPTNATNQNVSWNSSAPGVATVTGTGLGPVTVTAVTAGTTTVTVTTADGSHTASCLVTVTSGSTDGTATITITLAQITDIAPSITIPILSKSGTSVSTPPNSVDLAAIGVFDSVSWSVDGDPAGTGATITLDADDYDVGSHFLTVLVMKDGAPYNKTVSFSVEN